MLKGEPKVEIVNQEEPIVEKCEEPKIEKHVTETPKGPLPEMEEVKTFNILGFQISIKRKRKVKPTDFDIIEF